ncbi:MAG: hypothetical protein ACFFEF_00515 [Candidatus Thorarchaeota archaeon]
MQQLTSQRNTVLLSTLAIIASLGIIARMFLRIPLVPGFFELTPGFLFSLLGGVVGGIPGGIFCGAIVGFGGALAGGEFFLLPMVGNIFLGVGTGIAIHLENDRYSSKYALIAILGGGLIGGFIPSMTIFGAITESFELTLIVAVADLIQALLWAAVAILIDRTIIKRILGNYIYLEVMVSDISIDMEQ